MFGWDEEEKSQVIDPKGCPKKCDCQQAVEDCPVDAITLEE